MNPTCDNIDCEHSEPPDEVVVEFRVTLKEEFGGDKANWCEWCVSRDDNMIAHIDEYKTCEIDL